MDKKTKRMNLLLICCIVAILIVLIIGNSLQPEEEHFVSAFVPDVEDEYYYVNGHTIFDFSDVVMEQFQSESELIVSSVDASVKVELKQTGAFQWGALTKKQNVKYKGTGKFYVDLSQVGTHSISLDEDRKVVSIEIPHARMLPMEIDPTRFEFEDTQNGLLTFGDLKFTPKEYNDLENMCKLLLENEINTASNRQRADERAIEEMTRLYEPVIQAVDEDYTLEVTFIGGPVK